MGYGGGSSLEEGATEPSDILCFPHAVGEPALFCTSCSCRAVLIHLSRVTLDWNLRNEAEINLSPIRKLS